MIAKNEAQSTVDDVQQRSNVEKGATGCMPDIAREKMVTDVSYRKSIIKKKKKKKKKHTQKKEKQFDTTTQAINQILQYHLTNIIT